MEQLNNNKKIAKSKGAFYKSNNGKWSIDTKVKVNGKWKHLYRTGYDTLNQAKADFDEQKKLFIEKYDLSYVNKNISLELLIERYLAFKKKTIRPNTLNSYKTGCNKILDYFGNTVLKNVFNKDTIIKWHTILINNDESITSKNNLIYVMQDLLTFAYRQEFIDAKTFQSCDVSIYKLKIDHNTTEKVVWTPEEEDAFYKVVKEENEMDYFMFKVFFNSTCRVSEFLALTPSSFDFDNGRLTIDKQYSADENGHRSITNNLKTSNSYRVVSISKPILEMVKNYIDEMHIKEDDFLFPSLYAKGKPMSKETINNKLKMYCKKANIREITSHSARHIQATRMASVCETGGDIEIASKRFGHTPSMFMNTYAKHINEEKEKELLNKLGI